MDGKIGVVSRPPLLERDSSLAAITRALESVPATASGSSLLVVAPAGMGKTAVLEMGRGAAAAGKFRIASAVGSRMEMGMPFGLVGQAIVALGGSQVDDPVELEALGGQPARLYRMFRWLTQVAAECPLLLALDDLHWADPDSLELIGFMSRRLAGCPILLLGSLRPEPNPAWMLARELVGSGHATMVSLEPLSAEASQALLERRISGRLDPEQRDHVVSACAGTPLLLEAAAASLSGGGSLPSPSDDGGSPSGTTGFRWSLLLDRFAGLGDDAFRFVRAASILGVRFQPHLAGTLAELDEPAWEGAHRRLRQAGLLEDLGGGWAGLIHPLFAQALLESEPVFERERAHARAFRLLTDRGAPDALAAEHAHAAGLTGDPLAIEITARAGRQALRQGAVEVAAVHLGNAVELAGIAAPAELLLDYASALAAQAQNDKAERVCAGLLGRIDLPAAVQVPALALLARIAMLTGRPAQAERRCEEAAAAAAHVDQSTEAAALVTAVMACNMTSPLPWTLATVSRALSMVPAHARARGPLEYLSALARLQAGDPSGEGLLARGARSWPARRDHTQADLSWTMAVWTVGSLSLLEDLEGATEVFERQFEQAVQDGAPVMMMVLSVGYSDSLSRMGRSAEAVELLQRTVALSDWAMPPWYDLALAVSSADLGHDEDAEAHIEVVRSFAARVPPEYYAVIALWLCVLDSRRLMAAGEP
ncbi:MAG TPA: AAA family ATPase, partial [Solirubrobacteraceae bacterium]|nr:AAA family ATPase [Solirubrobacteraceae bacterium]